MSKIKLQYLLIKYIEKKYSLNNNFRALRVCQMIIMDIEAGLRSPINYKPTIQLNRCLYIDIV